MPPQTKKVKGVYEWEVGNWCGRYLTPNGRWVRKSFGRDRAAALDWVDEACRLRRTTDGVLATTAKTHKVVEEVKVAVVTVDMLCIEFLAYIKKNLDEYRDQENPARRIEEIRGAFGYREAAGVNAPEIEDWLDTTQDDRELANATMN
ncbi:hypothetical protein [Granulicella arctica]|uniref:hypothetical protein n=1 Tax=Granulicella arctica TaxID=940613 RepID=UPI0021E02100|nr:hypothetical protein [Granulicella arctica]